MRPLRGGLEPFIWLNLVAQFGADKEEYLGATQEVFWHFPVSFVPSV
jgi:hypothetical protein